MLQEDVEERSSSDHRPCLLDALGTQIQTSGGRLEPRAKPTKGLAFGLFFIEDVKVSQTLHCKCILNIIYIILIYTQFKGSLIALDGLGGGGDILGGCERCLSYQSTPGVASSNLQEEEVKAER